MNKSDIISIPVTELTTDHEFRWNNNKAKIHGIKQNESDTQGSYLIDIEYTEGIDPVGHRWEFVCEKEDSVQVTKK